MSKNGADWVTISGGQVSWSPPTKMIYFKNQFLIYLNSEVYVSSDGVNYVKKKVSVSDPNKLTPKDYLYLEEKGGYCSVTPSTVVSDGKFLYSAQSDYFGVSILRSSDGIKWEMVCFNKDKYLYSEFTQFVIGNGKYLITCSKNKVFVSSNGKDWTLQDFARGDMSRVLGGQNEGEFEYIPPSVYNFNGTYFVQCFYTKDKIDISNDYKKFYEYSVDREVSDILYVDEKFIITEEAVIDYSAAKSDISNGFKNATESPNKKATVSKESAPSSTVKTNITINKIKEFKFPDYINSVIWDGSKYIATGGSHPGYTYTSNDGKSWKTTELGIYTPRNIAYNGSIYTITGGDYIGDQGIAVSKNGINWNAVSGKTGKEDVLATIPNSTLIWFKGKLFRFESTKAEVDISTNGSSFTSRTINVEDPRKLVPAGSRHIYFSINSVVSDGTYLYALYRYLLRDSIIRSSDGINWENVYFPKNEEAWIVNKIQIHNNQYMVFYNDKMVVSYDGENWVVQPSYFKDFYAKDPKGQILPVDVYFYKENWIIQPYIEKYEDEISSGKLYITKDLKNFVEYKIEDNTGSFLFIDNNVLITSEKVYNGKVIKEFALGTQALPSIKAVSNSSKVLVNGVLNDFEAYNINGNNYFKLRDIAKVLNGTQKQFEVGWNESKKAIDLTSGKEYTTVGGEMQVSKNLKTETAYVTNSKIYLDGKEIQLNAYNINGNNYFKLRDIGEKINFTVTWDEAAKIIMINT